MDKLKRSVFYLRWYGYLVDVVGACGQTMGHHVLSFVMLVGTLPAQRQ